MPELRTRKRRERSLLQQLRHQPRRRDVSQCHHRVPRPTAKRDSPTSRAQQATAGRFGRGRMAHVEPRPTAPAQAATVADDPDRPGRLLSPGLRRHHRFLLHRHRPRLVRWHRNRSGPTGDRTGELTRPSASLHPVRPNGRTTDSAISGFARNGTRAESGPPVPIGSQRARRRRREIIRADPGRIPNLPGEGAGLSARMVAKLRQGGCRQTGGHKVPPTRVR